MKAIEAGKDGEIRIKETSLARQDPELALRLSLLGIGGEISERDASRRLAKAGLLEAETEKIDGPAAAEAFRWLCEEGDLAWAGGMRAWAI